MRIGLNLLHSHHEIGGVWNYTGRLVQALGTQNNAHQYIAFVTDKSSCLVPRSSRFERVKVQLDPVSRFHRVLYENTLLQICARKYRLDLIHWFANTNALFNTVPSVVSLYDLLPFEDNNPFRPVKRFYLKTMLRHAAKSNLLFLPMSDFTRDRAHEFLGISHDKMVVVPAVLDHSFQPASNKRVDDFRKKYHLPKKFWLYVANFYPHKNHLRLLQAYHYLVSNGFDAWPLVLRGDMNTSYGEVSEFIRKFSLENHLFYIPRVKEEELPILYSTSTALVFPSLHEGGGIPVMEAMACGCPVVASNIPPMQEFGGGAVILFDPLSSISIAYSMRKFQEDILLRIHSKELGLNKVENFRPHRVVPKVIEAYNRALS